MLLVVVGGKSDQEGVTMVTFSIGDAKGIPGVKEFDIEIDPDQGLEPADVDEALKWPSGPEVFADRPVQVNVYAPSTVDRVLLDTLIERVKERFKGWGIEPAWNIQVPPKD